MLRKLQQYWHFDLHDITAIVTDTDCPISTHGNVFMIIDWVTETIELHLTQSSLNETMILTCWLRLMLLPHCFCLFNLVLLWPRQWFVSPYFEWNILNVFQCYWWCHSIFNVFFQCYWCCHCVVFNVYSFGDVVAISVSVILG